MKDIDRERFMFEEVPGNLKNYTKQKRIERLIRWGKDCLIRQIRANQPICVNSIEVPVNKEKFKEIFPLLKNYVTFRISSDPSAVVLSVSTSSNNLERMNSDQLEVIEWLIQNFFKNLDYLGSP